MQEEEEEEEEMPMHAYEGMFTAASSLMVTVMFVSGDQRKKKCARKRSLLMPLSFSLS